MFVFGSCVCMDIDGRERDRERKREENGSGQLGQAERDYLFIHF